ncbi:MAG TPA: GAF domain-containing protein [Actinocrinis sp.]|uniref:GAF domain-containing protein n=1 Tax=Actinocrinis sp. TaxID=1920516 RepID=UPI002D3E1DE4|nr:GAF domain-containing protein [Actinocrinis sp.]HZU56415.1 GAF domain-containing protein [Actinocrinis sp.]
MGNPWLALEIGADPRRRAGQLRRAHEAFVTGSSIAGPVRPVVADSWRRSAGAQVAPDALAPVDLVDEALEEYRRSHPLATVMPLLRDLLGAVADDGEHVLAVCDAVGRLLWVEGHAGVLRKAEAMNFVPGASWDEGHAGTNAPGVATAVDHAVQIFAAEHYSSLVQPWTCAAAPIHDPRTGVLLGAVDITGGDHLASPQSLALVQATARAAEAHLAGSLPPLSPVLGTAVPAVLQALGRDEALLTVGPQSLRLGRRHSEIVVLLARHGDGLTGDQLCLELYGERTVNPVTLRAELSRLRHLLGPKLLDSRPYRLRVPVEADFLEVAQALELGAVSEAARAYRGPLLPESDAPGVARMRDRLANQLRAALLTRRDPGLLDTWTRTAWGDDDLQAWEALLASLPESSPRRAMAAVRVGQLRREYGLPVLPRSGNDPW